MKAGNSGATIRRGILKEGRFCQEQGLFMQKLGAGICPEVYALSEEGYMMEELQEYVPQRMGLDDIAHHLGKLDEFCWSESRNPYVLGWKGLLLEKFPDLEDLLEEIYPAERQLFYCVIHGDPTFANVLWRGEGKYTKWIIADPIPPAQQPYIPPLKAVDLGKVYQSCLGWESLNFGWPELTRTQVNMVLSEGNTNDILFWALVHIKRLIPYSLDKTEILDWADIQIRDITDELHIRLGWDTP